MSPTYKSPHYQEQQHASLHEHIKTQSFKIIRHNTQERVVTIISVKHLISSHFLNRKKFMPCPLSCPSPRYHINLQPLEHKASRCRACASRKSSGAVSHLQHSHNTIRSQFSESMQSTIWFQLHRAVKFLSIF
jgi:hypothetical protein